MTDQLTNLLIALGVVYSVMILTAGGCLVVCVISSWIRSLWGADR